MGQSRLEAAERLRQFIADYTRASGGVAPSYDDMQEGMGWRSRSYVHRLVADMKRAGMVRFMQGKSRAIEAVPRREYFVAENVSGVTMLRRIA